MHTDLEKLLKLAEKFKAGTPLPKPFLRAIDIIAKAVPETAEAAEKLNKLHAKGLVAIKQKLKKNAPMYEAQLATYRASPEANAPVKPSKEAKESESSSDSSSDSDSDTPKKPTAKTAKPAPGKAAAGKKAAASSSDSSSDSDSEDEAPKKPATKPAAATATAKAAAADSDESSDWDSSESSSSEDEGGTPQYTREYFLKKVGEPEKPLKKVKRVRAVAPKPDENAAAEAAEPKVEVKAEKVFFPKDAEITHAMMVAKLQEIVAARGKKGTDKNDMIDTLKKLAEISETAKLGVAMRLKIFLHLVAAEFDAASTTPPMSTELWNSCFANVGELLRIVRETPTLIVGDHVTEENENLSDTSKPLAVRGSVLGTVERLDDEFTRTLQSADPHTVEYISHLRDENRLVSLLVAAQEMVERIGVVVDICRLYLRRIEHVYIKLDYREFAEKGLLSSPALASAVSSPTGTDERATALMARLCKYIYHNDKTARIRSRAMLCHIYHHALHDRWFEARDLMLMSHLQETVTHADIETHILFNRTMVQLGLCAFRAGLIVDAHHCLQDLVSSGRAKELLAQGPTQQKYPGAERNVEQEKIERRRQLPFHMHINVELLECVYLTSAMLLEIPNMAAHPYNHKRLMISKHFRKYWDFVDRQIFHGPPENTRDHVIAAARALAACNWNQAQTLIRSIKIWSLFPTADKVKDMLSLKIQEEGLRTYLFTYSGIYDSISLDTLAQLFDLPQATVHRIVSKMIMSDELHASLNQPTNTIVVHRSDLSKLHHLALLFTDKSTTFIEKNEFLFEQRSGVQGFREQQQRAASAYSNQRRGPGQRPAAAGKEGGQQRLQRQFVGGAGAAQTQRPRRFGQPRNYHNNNNNSNNSNVNNTATQADAQQLAVSSS
ncbi:eukaryotic translation initiation factor 3 subunit C [Capsaspora owczarzaki ATCC 30864]|uniref:Eukaryotic translation initiation factor 3 subunit C n=3 Tax=Capsaspora owczarzaki (strain ATCC 30864) TaxID=595528 RepID=A0A0D2X567_CAPO3|nr:eukaryotic translation initiation factor 3 subunit C [Capsaspora owczarzaki ATCC 30864]